MPGATLSASDLFAAACGEEKEEKEEKEEEEREEEEEPPPALGRLGGGGRARLPAAGRRLRDRGAPTRPVPSRPVPPRGSLSHLLIFRANALLSAAGRVAMRPPRRAEAGCTHVGRLGYYLLLLLLLMLLLIACCGLRSRRPSDSSWVATSAFTFLTEIGPSGRALPLRTDGFSPRSPGTGGSGDPAAPRSPRSRPCSLPDPSEGSGGDQWRKRELDRENLLWRIRLAPAGEDLWEVLSIPANTPSPCHCGAVVLVLHTHTLPFARVGIDGVASPSPQHGDGRV